MTLFSIGYATKPIHTVLEQLGQHEVNAVADVRSVPYSKAFPDYHRENLQKSLAEAGIHYVYLGDELGPRSKNQAHYDESGQVQFDRLMKSALFLRGIERLQSGLEKNLNIALLCAEKDPAVCHRSLLVAHYLHADLGLEVQHITYDGILESQEELEQRLIKLQDLQPDLLTGVEDLKQLAYRNQLKKYAYKKDIT